MKRLLAILLAALMLLSLAACGDNSGGKTPDGNDNTTMPGQTDTGTPGGSENNPNAHILDEDRKVNAQKFEQAFYSAHKTKAETTGSDETALLLEKLKANPDLMRQLIKAVTP